MNAPQDHLGYAQVETKSGLRFIGRIAEKTIGNKPFLHIALLQGTARCQLVPIDAIALISPCDESTAKTIGSRTSIESVLLVVARHFNVSLDALTGRSRIDHIVRVRHIGYALASWLGYSSASIGKAFGRNHGTVLAGVESLDVRLKTDRPLKADLELLKGALK